MVLNRERLISTADVREALVRRKCATESKPPPKLESELVKHVQFTRDRDLFIRWVYLNWPSGGTETRLIFCSPGVLDKDSLAVRIVLGQNDERWLRGEE